MTTIADIADQATIDVPTAGRVLGIGRDASYAAAAANQIPVLKLGRSLRVPVPRLLAMLGVNVDGSENDEAGVMAPALDSTSTSVQIVKAHDDAPQ
jgi:hypothetical protein